jgi:hypothetical protein
VVGHQICVSYPGNASSEINTYASAKFGATASVAAPVPTDVVVGTNVNCGKYYQVKGASSYFMWDRISGSPLTHTHRERLLPGDCYGAGHFSF